MLNLIILEEINEMRVYLSCFIIFCGSAFSQNLDLKTCLKGEDYDMIKFMDKLNENSYLLNIRSFSKTNDFQNNLFAIDSFYLGSTWIVKFNAGGDTLWKKRLPNSEKAFQYITNYFGSFPFPDYEYPVYTIFDEEIILHYTSVDKIDSTFSVDTTSNLFVHFGILYPDGQYKLEPFPVDTIRRDSNILPYSMDCIKLNDTIYQVAFKFGRHDLQFEPRGMRYIRIYTINIDSREVKKIEIPGFDQYVIKGQNNFLFWKQAQGSLDTASFLTSISPDGEIFKTIALVDSGRQVEVNNFNVLQNGNILILGRRGDTQPYEYENYPLWYVITPLMLEYKKHTIKPFTDSFFNSLIFFPENYFDYRSYFNFHVPNAPPYFIFQETTYDPTYRSKEYLVKFNEVTGDTISVTYIEGAYFTGQLTNDGIIFLEDSMYNFTGGYGYKNKVAFVNWNGNTKWETQLPDFIQQDSVIMRNTSGVSNYSALNYNGSFLVAASYSDTARLLPVNGRMLYFLISYDSGKVLQLRLPDELESLFYRSFDDPALRFFFSDNKLSVISQEESKCLSDSSLSDVVVYTYIDTTFTSINSHKSNLTAVVYPNPVNLKLTIRLFDNYLNTLFSVFDLSGKFLTGNKITGIETSIDVSALPNGMYLLNILSDKISETKKFQVIR